MLFITWFLLLVNYFVLVLGAHIDTDQDYTNITKRAVPILYEKCYGDVATKTTYYIQLLALHRNGKQTTLATACGNPKGSLHYNLHIDRCKPGKSPACNNCRFPFTTYEQYKALRNKYLDPLNNWHAFQYKMAGYPCICFWDSVSGTKYWNCFEEDVKDALLVFVSNLEGVVGHIWEELVDLDWRPLVLALVVAACVLLVPIILDALIAAGVAITAVLVAETTATFIGAMAVKYGIHV